MSMHRVKALVLKSQNFGEADRKLVLLGEEIGKQGVIVKGARRPRSRFLGSTEPFNYLEVLLYPGKNLATLSQGEVVYSFQGLREDLTRFAYASLWVEIMDAFLPEGQEALAPLRFLLAAFIVLEKTKEPEVLNLAFQIRLLDILGYLPELEACVACHGEIKVDALYISAAEGGVVCPSCGKKHPHCCLISKQDLNKLKRLLVTDLRKLDSVGIAPPSQLFLKNFLLKFLEERIDKPLKAAFLIENINTPQ